MNNRDPLELDDSISQLVEKMAEGNSVARQVIIDYVQNFPDPALTALLDLDDMNIRGAQLETAYLWAGRNIYDLAEAAWRRSKELVDVVNRAAAFYGWTELAVTSGASSSRQAKPKTS